MNIKTTSIAALAMAAAIAAPGQTGGGAAPAASIARVDHVVYGTPDLDAGIAAIEKLVGVRATPGGQHPGRGTRNALVALGPGRYLEILGPDPGQPKPDKPRSFGIDDLKSPRLVAWAAKGENLERTVKDAQEKGVPLGDVRSGSRKRPDGVLLSWRYSDPAAVVGDRLVPFLIDWGESPHPSKDAAGGATLVSLRVEHPTPEPIRKMLATLGLEVPVAKGAAPALVATIRGPRGVVELR